MFCAISECNFPLHTLLADAIECFGGSTDLIRIFNRLGVVTSKDTQARYVEHMVTQYEDGTHLKDLIRGRFTVASLDNLDFLQSHAAVYCGDQHRSTHVTTIQVVQPKPTSLSAGVEIASSPGPKEGLVHTVCACANLSVYLR